MGYYTEFKFKAKLKEDAPAEIITLIDNIVNHNLLAELFKEKYGKDLPSMYNVSDTPNLPIDHPFGKCNRWYMLFHSNNFDPVGFSGSKFENNELIIHTEFKNYSDEIEKFIDWITPYIENLEYAISKGEDQDRWVNYI